MCNCSEFTIIIYIIRNSDENIISVFNMKANLLEYLNCSINLIINSILLSTWDVWEAINTNQKLIFSSNVNSQRHAYATGKYQDVIEINLHSEKLAPKLYRIIVATYFQGYHGSSSHKKKIFKKTISIIHSIIWIVQSQILGAISNVRGSYQIK